MGNLQSSEMFHSIPRFHNKPRRYPEPTFSAADLEMLIFSWCPTKPARATKPPPVLPTEIHFLIIDILTTLPTTITSPLWGILGPLRDPLPPQILALSLVNKMYREAVLKGHLQNNTFQREDYTNMVLFLHSCSQNPHYSAPSKVLPDWSCYVRRLEVRLSPFRGKWDTRIALSKMDDFGLLELGKFANLAEVLIAIDDNQPGELGPLKGRLEREFAGKHGNFCSVGIYRMKNLVQRFEGEIVPICRRLRSVRLEYSGDLRPRLFLTRNLDINSAMPNTYIGRWDVVGGRLERPRVELDEKSPRRAEFECECLKHIL